MKELLNRKSEWELPVRRLFYGYSGGDYVTINSLARGKCRLSREAVEKIKTGTVDQIDAFLINLCYLDDLNAALRSGLVELSPENKSANDGCLYRGITLIGAYSWFNVPRLKTNNYNQDSDKQIYKSDHFISVVRERIDKGNFVIVDPAPMSTSYSKYIASDFSKGTEHLKSAKAQVVVRITAKDNKFPGVNIEEMSQNSYEKEVLLPAGIKLKVTECRPGENTKVEVCAEIISDLSKFTKRSS